MHRDLVLEILTGHKWRNSAPGLDRIRHLLELLGNPQATLKFVHVAGTNGKGSTSAFIASVLKSAGYKTGLFTSPFLHRFNERIRINNIAIDDESLIAIAKRVIEISDGLQVHPNEFEMITAVAMEYFARSSCDIVVLEVGLGGRLDPTNIIEDPLVSVITNIGFDHTKILGETLEAIAYEKGGIIKHGVPVVMYDQSPSVESVIRKVCETKGANLFLAGLSDIVLHADSLDGQVFDVFGLNNLRIELLGKHQRANAAVAVSTVYRLKELGFNLTEEAIREGMKEAKWPGRFEIVSRSPIFVADGGHNVQCASVVCEALQSYFEDLKKILVIGVIKEKDIHGILGEFYPIIDRFVTVMPNHPEAMPSDELALIIKTMGKEVIDANEVSCGVQTAAAMTGCGSVACSFGSLYMTGAVRSFFGLE